MLVSDSSFVVFQNHKLVWKKMLELVEYCVCPQKLKSEKSTSQLASKSLASSEAPERKILGILFHYSNLKEKSLLISQINKPFVLQSQSPFCQKRLGWLCHVSTGPSKSNHGLQKLCLFWHQTRLQRIFNSNYGYGLPAMFTSYQSCPAER